MDYSVAFVALTSIVIGFCLGRYFTLHRLSKVKNNDKKPNGDLVLVDALDTYSKKLESLLTPDLDISFTNDALCFEVWNKNIDGHFISILLKKKLFSKKWILTNGHYRKSFTTAENAMAELVDLVPTLISNNKKSLISDHRS